MLLRDVREADSQVKNDIEKRFDLLGQEKMAHIKPVPTNTRDIDKENLKNDVLMHHDFDEAKISFKKIMCI